MDLKLTREPEPGHVSARSSVDPRRRRARRAGSPSRLLTTRDRAGAFQASPLDAGRFHDGCFLV